MKTNDVFDSKMLRVMALSIALDRLMEAEEGKAAIAKMEIEYMLLSEIQELEAMYLELQS